MYQNGRDEVRADCPVTAGDAQEAGKSGEKAAGGKVHSTEQPRKELHAGLADVFLRVVRHCSEPIDNDRHCLSLCVGGTLPEVSDREHGKHASHPFCISTPLTYLLVIYIPRFLTMPFPLLHNFLEGNDMCNQNAQGFRL